MTIAIKDPVATGALAQVGETIPSGVQRNYAAAGAHNTTGGSITLSVHLVPTGGAADATNRIINRAVPAGKTDICPELIGRGLNAGGSLWVAGAAGMTFGYTAIDTITG